MSVAPGQYQWQQPPPVRERRGETRFAVTLLVLSLVGALWLALQPARTQVVPQLGAGTVFEVSPLRLSFGTARVIIEDPPVFYAHEGTRYVVVQVTATGTADRYVPSASVARMFTLTAPGLQEFGRPSDGEPVDAEVSRAPDKSYLSAVQPGVETPLLLVWEQSVDAPPPTSLTLNVLSLDYVPLTLDETWFWRRGDVAARVTLPVQES